MTREFRVKNGVKVRRVASYPHRYGGDKVHLEVWQKTSNPYVHTRGGKGWVLFCNKEGSYHTYFIDPGSDLTITCKTCLDSGLVPRQWLPQLPQEGESDV